MKIFVTILLISFYTITSFGQAVTKEEYEIYSIILKDINQKDTYPFVVLNETKISKYSAVPNDSVEKDYKRKNRISVKLNQSFSINIKHWMVSKSEVDELLNEGGKDFKKIQEERRLKGQAPYAEPDPSIIWKHFSKKYSNAQGYFQFSRIGFNARRNIAKVVIGFYSDGGFLKTYYLSKNKTKWKINKFYEQSWSH